MAKKIQSCTFPEDREQIKELVQHLHPGVRVGDIQHLPMAPPRQERAQVAVEMLRKSPNGLVCIKAKGQVDASTNISIRWTTENRHHDSDLTDSTSQSAQDDNLCVVCFERLCDVELGPCQHQCYCRKCFTEALCGWPKGQAAPSCPICRTLINSFVLID